MKFKKKLIVNNKIIGAGLSRNKGIKVSKGNYIAFCDADDLWEKNKLKFQLQFMKNNKIDFSHSSYFIIDIHSKIIGKFDVPKNIFPKELMKSCDIGLSSVMISKVLMKKKLFSKLKTKEDYLLWINLIKYTKSYYGINKNLVSWRLSGSSLSRSNFQKIKDAFLLYKRHLNFSSLFSIFCVIRLTFYALKKKIRIYS